jgi:hypothetical protein
MPRTLMLNPARRTLHAARCTLHAAPCTSPSTTHEALGTALRTGTPNFALVLSA